jgi:hypothetical protein
MCASPGLPRIWRSRPHGSTKRESQRNNDRDSLNGALAIADGWFQQMIEELSSGCGPSFSAV